MQLWNNTQVKLAAAFVGLGLVWVAPGFLGYAMHITDHDAALYYYPLFEFYARALQSGQSFLWVPGIFSGFPAYASQVAGFLDPLNILIFSIFDGFTGTHIRLFFDIVLTFVFSYLAARSFGLSRTASALVGPSFLIAFHTRFLSNPIITNTLFLIPLLIYVVNGVLDLTLRRRTIVALLALSVGSTLLAGYTQIVLYALLAASLYAGIRIFLERVESVRSLASKSIAPLVGIICGVVVGLPFILPALSLLPLSARSEVASYADATRKVIELGDFTLIAVPDHFYIPYITAGRKPLYVGTLWGLLAVTACVYVVTRFVRKRKIPFDESRLGAVACTAILFLLFSVAHSPLYYLLSKLPLFELFRFPYRFMYVGVFFFALLGAFGFDRIAMFLKDRIVRICLYVLLGAYTLLLGLIVGSNFLSERSIRFMAETGHALASTLGVYHFLDMSKGDAHYAEALERALFAYHELLSFVDIGILLPTAILGFSIVAMLALMRNKVTVSEFKYAALVISCATVLMIPILRYEHFYLPTQAGAAPHLALDYASLEDMQQYRFYSFLANASLGNAIPPQYKLSRPEMDAVKEVTVRAGVPNYHLHHPMGSVDGYDQFQTVDMLTAVEAAGGELYAGYGSGTYAERTDRLLQNVEVLAMMGGKYVISGVELSHPRLVFRASERVTKYEIVLRLYEVQNPYPRVFMPSVVYGEFHESFASLYASSSRRNFEGEAYLDCEPCAPHQGGIIRNYTSKNGLHTMEVETKGGYVMLSEAYTPGWRAWINDTETSLVRANGLYMAIHVPAGKHQVRFEYQGLHNELRVLKLLGLVRD